MIREGAIKHLEIIKAFAAGKAIQYYNTNTCDWDDIPNPVNFYSTVNYRVKPAFKPKNGDRILVSNYEDCGFVERIFVNKSANGKYSCLAGNNNNIISAVGRNNYIELIHWNYANPIYEK